MSEKVLYALTGLFETPDQIIDAAEKTSDSGYKKYDVNTPYPLHGMNQAMKLPPSKLGYAALVFGLSGTVSALALMYWMAVIDYAHVIGGKPYFPLPAFVPVMFEVTVLSAAIATVFTMLFVVFKFPNNSHPLHDTEYMKSVSRDKYGLCILAEDEKFDENGTLKFLEELGATNITHQYFTEDSYATWWSVLDKKFAGILAVTAIATSLVVYIGLNKVLYMQPFSWMMEQEKLNPQKGSVLFADGFSMRNPVQGTIARGDLPYEYAVDPEGASKLVNPLPITEANLQLGKVKYDIYCSPCHGFLGEGDSRLRGQFPNPPSLHSEKVRDWTDGRIYHVIAMGQNVMPSYSSQLSRNEKWATILYVRALQRSLNAKESDLQ